MTDVDDRATAPWALPRGPSRRTAVAVAIGGALLITLAVLNSGYRVAYIIGLAAIAVAAVMYRDTSVRTERRRWRQLGLAALVAGTVGAVAVLTPLLIQRVSAGDHLATLTVGVADRRLAAAAEVGDVLALVTGGHTTTFSIVETESGSELGRQRVPAHRYAIGRGDVAAVAWRESGTLTAIGVDGSRLWRIDISGQASTVPIAVLDDGAVVISTVESDNGRDLQVLTAIAPDGSERWRSELPVAHRPAPSVVRPTNQSRPLLAEVLVIRQNPVQDGARLIATVDADTGELEEFARADQVVTGFGYAALLDHNGSECVVTMLDGDLEFVAAAQLDCAADDRFEPVFLAFGRHVALEQHDRVYLVDASTADVEAVEDPWLLIAPEVAYADGTASVRRVGGPTISSDRHATLTAGPSTVAITHHIDSFNPMRPRDQTEVVLYDIETAERCAAARFDVASVSVFPLPACRAVVTAGDRLVLVGAQS